MAPQGKSNERQHQRKLRRQWPKGDAGMGTAREEWACGDDTARPCTCLCTTCTCLAGPQLGVPAGVRAHAGCADRTDGIPAALAVNRAVSQERILSRRACQLNPRDTRPGWLRRAPWAAEEIGRCRAEGVGNLQASPALGVSLHAEREAPQGAHVRHQQDPARTIPRTKNARGLRWRR